MVNLQQKIHGWAIWVCKYRYLWRNLFIQLWHESHLNRAGLGDCLNDEPAESLYHDEKNMPPGAVYGPDFQCSTYFPEHKHCVIDPEKFCEMIYCKPIVGKATSCQSNGYPLADGSKCGENKVYIVNKIDVKLVSLSSQNCPENWQRHKRYFQRYLTNWPRIMSSPHI